MPIPRPPRTIAIVPNAFKGTLTAHEAANAMARGLRRALPRVRLLKIPMADGGDGTARAIVGATGGKFFSRRVHDPLGKMISAPFALTGDRRTAIIELAQVSGVALLKPHQLNPLHASTRGTGELMRAALDYPLTRIILGIGGSASTDGGTGLARALGVRFLDAQGQDLPEGGAALLHLAHIDTTALDPRLASVAIEVACDVKNPLYGPRGAAHVFGPQKGATPAMVNALDQGLRCLARIIKKDLGVNVARLPGAGAAGGAGAGLVAFLQAHLRPGAPLVADLLDLKNRLAPADLVITGEGRLDVQTAHGKAPAAVAAIGRELRIPVIALCGSIAPAAAVPGFLGLSGAYASSPENAAPPRSPAAAAKSLERTAYQLGLRLKHPF